MTRIAAQVLRNHGASISEEQRHHGSQPYLLASFDELGFNYRMTDLQAAVGRVQLTRLPAIVQARRRIAQGLRKLRDKELENPWKKHDNIPL